MLAAEAAIVGHQDSRYLLSSVFLHRPGLFISVIVQLDYIPGSIHVKHWAWFNVSEARFCYLLSAGSIICHHKNLYTVEVWGNFSWMLLSIVSPYSNVKFGTFYASQVMLLNASGFTPVSWSVKLMEWQYHKWIWGVRSVTIDVRIRIEQQLSLWIMQLRAQVPQL